MADLLERRIEEMLQQGLSKKTIWNDLKNSEDRRRLLFHINNISAPRARRRFQAHNLVLALLLAFVTAKKLIVAFSFGVIDIALVASLVVPAINVFVLREVLRFHRLGYQFLFVLSILALFHPDNHQTREMLIHIALIGLSAFLYLTLFPRRELVSGA